jgi:hypothetical protein
LNPSGAPEIQLPLLSPDFIRGYLYSIPSGLQRELIFNPHSRNFLEFAIGCVLQRGVAIYIQRVFAATALKAAAPIKQAVCKLFLHFICIILIALTN